MEGGGGTSLIVGIFPGLRLEGRGNFRYLAINGAIVLVGVCMHISMIRILIDR
jgi:hypothetical protein